MHTVEAMMMTIMAIAMFAMALAMLFVLYYVSLILLVVTAALSVVGMGYFSWKTAKCMCGTGCEHCLKEGKDTCHS